MEWSEDDVRDNSLQPGGVYDAEVTDAEERVSRNGNPYINLKLRIYATPDSDEVKTVYDIIMPKMPRKLAHFCRAIDREDLFTSRTLAATDCIGRSVKVRMTALRNDRGYLEIDDYIVENAYTEAVTTPTAAPAAARPEMPKGPDAAAGKRARAAAPADDIPF
jgi:hypothetical protein